MFVATLRYVRVIKPITPMKKLLLCTLLACTFAAASASAGTFKIPNDDFGVASVDIPDSWKPEAIEKGVQANSPDSEIFLSIEAVGSEKGMKATIEESFKMLTDAKVTVDASTKHEQTFKVAGVDATELVYKGKLEGEDQTVSIVFVPIKDKVLVMTYWATASKEKDHSAEIGKIANSIKAL